MNVSEVLLTEKCLSINGVTHIPWDHPGDNPQLLRPFDRDNSRAVALQINKMAPVVVAVDSLTPTNKTSQVEFPFQDLLAPLRDDITVVGGDFYTDYAAASDRARKEADRLQDLIKSEKFVLLWGGIPAGIILGGFGALAMTGKIKNNGRSRFIALMLASIAGAGGIAKGFDILGRQAEEYQQDIIAAEISCQLDDLTLQKADHNNDPEEKDVAARTAIMQWKMQNFPDYFLTERERTPGSRIVVLGSGHYYPTALERSKKDLENITGLRDRLITRDATLYLANNIPDDQAIGRLNALRFKIGSMLPWQIKKIGDQLYYYPISDSSGNFFYYDPVLLPELAGKTDLSNASQLVENTTRYYLSLKRLIS